MKTLVILGLIMCSLCAKADFDLDSLKFEAFRPVLNKHLKEIEFYTAKLKSGAVADSSRFFAIALLYHCEKLKSQVKQFFSYETPKGSTPGLFIVGNQVFYGINLNQDPGSATPELLRPVNRMVEAAEKLSRRIKVKKEKQEECLYEIELISRDLRS